MTTEVEIRANISASNFISGEANRAWWIVEQRYVCASQGWSILQILSEKLRINVLSEGFTPEFFEALQSRFQDQTIIESIERVKDASPPTNDPGVYARLTTMDELRYTLACVYVAFYENTTTRTSDLGLNSDAVFMPYSQGQLPDPLMDPNTPRLFCPTHRPQPRNNTTSNNTTNNTSNNTTNTSGWIKDSPVGYVVTGGVGAIMATVAMFWRNSRGKRKGKRKWN